MQNLGNQSFGNYFSRTEVSRSQREETQEHPQHPEGFHSFAQDTTLHGARFLFVSNVHRRVVWNLAVVSCLGFCIYQVFLSVRAFYSYPFHTTVKTETAQDGRELAFPAVTLCNLNPANTRRFRDLYKFAFPHETPTKENIDRKIEDLTLMFAGSQEVLTKEFRERNADFLFRRPDSPEEEIERFALVSHQIEEMLLPRRSNMNSCSINGLGCAPKNFSKETSIAYDQCYTFNSGKGDHPLLNVTLAGKDSSLKLRLNVERSSYLKNPVAPSVGLALLIHDQKSYPFMEGYGIVIQPGISTVCAIKRREIINLRWPYATNCTSQPNDDIHSFYSYTKEACLRKCRNDYIAQKCGCTLPEVHDSGPICALNDTLLCLNPLQEQFGISKEKKVCEKNCPEPCEQVEYDVSLSYGGLQRDALIEHLMKFLNESNSSSVGRAIYEPLLNMTKLEREKFINDNIISLDIYFEDLAYEVIKQTPIYQTWTLVGNVGGTFGLFLGMSCLTVLEFLDFIFRRMRHLFKKQRIGKPRTQTISVG